MSSDSKILIEQANAAFYRALESSVIERMEEIWAHEDWVRCIHPGWDMVVGWSRVRESWAMIFDGGQQMRASPSEVRVDFIGNLALVTCLENITVFGESSFDSAQAVATNLFLRRDNRWLMVHHHASPIPMIIPDDSSDVIQ